MPINSERDFNSGKLSRLLRKACEGIGVSGQCESFSHARLAMRLQHYYVTSPHCECQSKVGSS